MASSRSRLDLSQVAGPVGIAGAVGSINAGMGRPLLYYGHHFYKPRAHQSHPHPGARRRTASLRYHREYHPPADQTEHIASDERHRFHLLILLMLVVTAHDIFKIVG